MTCRYFLNGKEIDRRELAATLLSLPMSVVHDAVPAVRDGAYQKLTWDTGETNADRYDLSKQISRIQYDKAGTSGFTPLDSIERMNEGVGSLTAYDHSNGRIVEKYIRDEKELADLVGKEIAEKLLAQEPKHVVESGTALSRRQISGLGLKVGGEGMRGFYDKILPAFLNKYARKWGAKVETGALSKGVTDPDAMTHRVYGRDTALSELNADQRQMIHEMVAAENDTPVHAISITPAMRESVMAGQPLFQRGQTADGSNSGPRVRLASDLIAHLPDRPSAEEQKIMAAVDRLAKKIVPGADVHVARKLGFSDELRQQVGASKDAYGISGVTYTGGRRQFIAWSLESPDAEGTLRHEALHYLLGTGLIRDNEWHALLNEAGRKNWITKHNIEGRHPDADMAMKLEESVAYEMQDWRRAPDAVPAKFKPLWERISRFLAQVADHVRRVFGADATASDVFSRILTGEVGARGLEARCSARTGSGRFHTSQEPICRQTATGRFRNGIQTRARRQTERCKRRSVQIWLRWSALKVAA
jgi:hypothetical protein